MVISGLNHTAFDLAVYASQCRSPATTQHSLPAAGLAVPDGTGYAQGSDERFHIAILVSRASWRKDILLSCEKGAVTCPPARLPSGCWTGLVSRRVRFKGFQKCGADSEPVAIGEMACDLVPLLTF
jgi:hypothetical protein